MFNVEFEEVTNQFCAEFDTVVHTGDATLGEKTITANGVYNASSDDLDGYSKVSVNVPTGGDTPVIESLSVTPTTSQQTYNDSEVDGYKPVVVAAMPTGTEGTPTATKGAVSNHSVAVTPSVTNQAGYIEGGTKTGTAVTVSASELDSGTKSISSNGTGIDVVGYAAVDVAVPNSYSAADEGKVVSSGALVAQTAHADVTPTTSDQTIDTTTNNSIKVKGDADLVAGNIKKDVAIFGVTGSYEGGGGGWSTEDFLAGLVPSGAIVADSVTQIGPIFYGNTGITSFLSNTITKILAGNAFFGCTALQTFKITATITQLQDGNHWQGCTSLTSLELPNMTANFSSYGARGCTSLTLIDAGKTGQINANAFNGCSVLNELILRKTSVATLQNISAFTNTPFASGGSGGTLYVPQSLISSYQSASNWSTILGYANNQIKAIEGSIYE